MGRGTKRSELTPLQRAGLEHLKACAAEGVTIQAYARRRQLPVQRLYQVAKVLRRKGRLPASPRRGRAKTLPHRVRAVRKPRFVEVLSSAVTLASSDSAPASWRARLPNGVVIEGSSDLGSVVGALAKL
jgi:hypothetical protein